jgi:hypothetical protein
VTFHLFHGIAVSFVLERLAEVRDSLQPRQNESGESFEAGIARQEQTMLGFKVENVFGAFEN